MLKRFPQSDQADNAQFWIGETYYRENWYEKAILEYQKVIEKTRKLMTDVLIEDKNQQETLIKILGN